MNVVDFPWLIIRLIIRDDSQFLSAVYHLIRPLPVCIDRGSITLNASADGADRRSERKTNEVTNAPPLLMSHDATDNFWAFLWLKVLI